MIEIDMPSQHRLIRPGSGNPSNKSVPPGPVPAPNNPRSQRLLHQVSSELEASGSRGLVVDCRIPKR